MVCVGIETPDLPEKARGLAVKLRRLLALAARDAPGASGLFEAGSPPPDWKLPYATCID